MASGTWIVTIVLLAITFLPDNGVEAIASKCNQTNCLSVDFDTDIEDCCGGVVYRHVDRYGERVSACCNWADTKKGFVGAMYSLETQDCCNYQTIIDKSTHRCCGIDGPYELATQGCCGGKIYDKAEKICCNDDELHSVSKGNSCCGNTPYDNSTHTCCAGEVVQGTGDCCGNAIYRPNMDLCCQTIQGSVIHTPDSHDLTSGAVQCCGTDTYRWANELCCNTVVHAKDSASLKCCDKATYNENTEICCQGQVHLRGMANACCGSDPYNEENQVCCDDEVVEFGGHGSCCDGEPYNKETSSCLTIYGLNGFIVTDVPEIPGITMDHLGENLTTYLSTEQFECGGILHYFDEGVTDCCGGAITFNSSQSLCCSSPLDITVVEKVSPNAVCCGEQSYNPDTQGCCHGDEVYSMATHQCCLDGGVIGVAENCYNIPACSVRRGNDRICVIDDDVYPKPRNVTYNSKNAFCTSSGVIAIPPGLDRCGDVIYRTSQELCCQDRLFRKFVNNKEQSCCQTIFEPRTFVPALETCYNGRIFPIPFEVARVCSGHVYDSRYDGCDVAGRIRRNEDILEKPDVCFNQNEALYFNKLYHSCCSGHLIAAGHTCCDVTSDCCQPNQRQGYNTETHMCCDGNLVTKVEGHKCCGAQTYDIRDSTKLCCLNKTLYDSHNGNVWCEGEAITGRLAANLIICRGNIYEGFNIKCCGAEKYDPDEELCCTDFKYPKTSDSWTCCGSVAYDTSDDVLCCDGRSLHPKTHQTEDCCGAVTFDTVFETCCTTGGSKFVTSAPGQCCSNDEEFDNSLHTCCDGLIHNYIANGECCGNHVIRDPTREFCCGGRLVRHHGDKRCCQERPISSNEECNEELV